MKTKLLLVSGLMVSMSLISQSHYELVKQSITRSGTLNQISKTIEPLNLQSKVSDFDSLKMSFTGNWGFGQSFSVSCSPTGDTVFVGSGAGVIIFDASDPYNPVKLSEISARALVDGSSYDPVNHLLYLAAYFSGIEVWDVSDIYNPQRLGRAPATGLPRGGVHFRNNSNGLPDHAFLANVVDGVDVFSVADPQNPSKVGTYNFSGSQLVWNSFKSGDTLFVAASAGGTKAIDLSDSPVLTNPFNINAASTSVHILGNLAYIVNYAYGLKIYDFSILPATLTGQIPQSGYPYNLTVFDNYAYIANSTTNPGGGVNIIDVSNPGSPQHITDYTGFQTYIAGKNNTVYTTGGTEGCLFLDVSEPSSPVVASAYPLPYSTWDVDVSGNYAYSGSNGFRVFDISDKNHPVQVGYDETQGDLVEVTGDIAIYCPKSMGSSNKVNIMDISNPANPEYIAHYLAPFMTYDINLKGNYAFIACWWDGFRVVDFSIPESPVLVAHEMGWVNGGIPGVEWCYVQALDVEGNYLYIVDYGPFEAEDTKGVYIFDITDPANPVFISRLPNYTGKAYDINASEGYAYLADSEAGFTVINVSDPTNAFEEAYLPLGDAAWAVDVFGNYAFVANYINEGVQVINIANPPIPFFEGHYRRSGCFAVNVTYNAGHVYVSDGPAGFGIYKFDLLSGTENNFISAEYNLQVQPNPANDEISVSIELVSSQNLMIELFNLEGMLIKTLYNRNENAGHFSRSFNIESLPKGIYLLKVNPDLHIISKKIVVL
jgi:hypothetical protein